MNLSKRKFLAVCQLAYNRSPTLEWLLRKSGHNARSCGLNKADWMDNKECKPKDIAWASTIFSMDEQVTKGLVYKFPKAKKKLVTLNVPDVHLFCSESLLETLSQKMNRRGVKIKNKPWEEAEVCERWVSRRHPTIHV